MRVRYKAQIVSILSLLICVKTSAPAAEAESKSMSYSLSKSSNNALSLTSSLLSHVTPEALQSQAERASSSHITGVSSETQPSTSEIQQQIPESSSTQQGQGLPLVLTPAALPIAYMRLGLHRVNRPPHISQNQRCCQGLCSWIRSWLYPSQPFVSDQHFQTVVAQRMQRAIDRDDHKEIIALCLFVGTRNQKAILGTSCCNTTLIIAAALGIFAVQMYQNIWGTNCS